MNLKIISTSSTSYYFMWKVFCEILRFWFTVLIWGACLEKFTIPSKNIIYCIIKFFSVFFFVTKILEITNFGEGASEKQFFKLCYSIICLACAWENFPLLIEVIIWLLLILLWDFQLICNLCSDEKYKNKTLINELGDLLWKDHPVILLIIAGLFWSLYFVGNSYQLLLNKIPLC